MVDGIASPPNGVFRPDGLCFFFCIYLSPFRGRLSFISFPFTHVFFVIAVLGHPRFVIPFFVQKIVIGICQYLLFSSPFSFTFFLLFFFSIVCQRRVFYLQTYNHRIAAVQCQHPSLKIGWISARQNFGRAARAGRVLDGFYKGVSFFSWVY